MKSNKEPATLLWKLVVLVPLRVADAFEEALAEEALAVSRYEITDSPHNLWRVEALFDAAPDPAPYQALLENLTRENEVVVGPMRVSEVPEQDWIAQSLERLAPVRAGRYYVCGHHDAAATPANAIQILIEAGQAFGTGHHETTYGCLLAMTRVGRLMGKPQKPLDLGCGTGVLAIAGAKTWRVPVVASDIDPIAARVTYENARANGVGKLVRTVTAVGLQHNFLRESGPYDFIVANILAGPLQTLAPAIARHTAPGGFVVLSGLLISQERAVAAAFRAQGLFRWRRQAQNGWVTLMLKDRRRKL